jgi:hypothetical protein
MNQQQQTKQGAATEQQHQNNNNNIDDNNTNIDDNNTNIKVNITTKHRCSNQGEQLPLDCCIYVSLFPFFFLSKLEKRTFMA